ncbi:hypothetical protein SAMN05880501_10466 [Ureibacillus xyleni]|uniref:Spore coat protein B n=1 Tax=Ureibacillus xyleni TaxID=614648 RepID=A0A285SCK9_9BACL|nr:hypothetical protein [Ureibacillus xyleni]SOC05470.1 hypothetical protein SAMN05880501_10466 [Ureibacillus xyleni]
MNKDLLESLEGQVIRVDRGGPHAAVGKLFKAGDDYFVLLTKKDGVVVYKTHHVKSITHDSKDQMAMNVMAPEGLENLFKEDDFKSVIAKLEHRWVKINPEKLEGVLDGVTDDYLTIIAKEEIIHVSMFHLRNISFGVLAATDGNEDDDDNSDDNNDDNKGNGRRRRRRS